VTALRRHSRECGGGHARHPWFFTPRPEAPASGRFSFQPTYRSNHRKFLPLNAPLFPEQVNDQDNPEDNTCPSDVVTVKTGLGRMGLYDVPEEDIDYVPDAKMYRGISATLALSQNNLMSCCPGEKTVINHSA
jgi:hypothetical protein